MRATRWRLPDERRSVNHAFTVGGMKGYLIVGFYRDDTPGEIFIKLDKAGSTISGLIDAVAILSSLLLQYGVPLRVICDKLQHTRFDPSGSTGNSEIPMASSPLDYVFTWLRRYVPPDAPPDTQLPLQEPKP